MSDDKVWEATRKAASELPSSEHNMDEKRKELIRRVLDFDIIDVRSYHGCRGDLLIEFTALEQDTAISVKRLAESMGFEVVVRQTPSMLFQIYCISEGNDVYFLKF